MGKRQPIQRKIEDISFYKILAEPMCIIQLDYNIQRDLMQKNNLAKVFNTTFEELFFLL